MPDDIMKKASGWLKKATETATEVAKAAHNEYQESGAKDIVEEKAKQAKEFLDEKGVTEKATEITSAASDQLDAVSGKKILDLVEERLEMQSGYNDILATKLEEALLRIKQLEATISEMKNK